MKNDQLAGRYNGVIVRRPNIGDVVDICSVRNPGRDLWDRKK